MPFSATSTPCLKTPRDSPSIPSLGGWIQMVCLDSFSIFLHTEILVLLNCSTLTCLFSLSILSDIKLDPFFHHCGAHSYSIESFQVSIGLSWVRRQALLQQTQASQHPTVSDLLLESVSLDLLFFQPDVNNFTVDKKTPPLHLISYYFPSGVHLAYIKELLSFNHCFISLLIFFLSIRQKTLLIEICQQENKQAAFDMLLVQVWADK